MGAARPILVTIFTLTVIAGAAALTCFKTKDPNPKTDTKHTHKTKGLLQKSS